MQEGQKPRAWEKTAGRRGWMGARRRWSLLAQGRASIMACAVFSLVIEPTSSLHIDRIQVAERASALRTLPPSLHSSQLAPITLRLKGGEGNASPPTSHIIAMGTVCGSILVLNELDLLSVVVRVGLTFFLAVIFLLSGVNKTTDSFHRPTHLFLAAMFPDICKKVWRPLVEKWLNFFCHMACKVFGGLENYLGKSDQNSYKFATALASRLTPARMMHAIGQLEIWCGMFMLISLAGTGSRGYRVPLAELSNVVLIFLMAGAVYSHLVLRDGHFLAPAVLGGLLLVRLACPVPRPKKKKSKLHKKFKASTPVIN